MLFTFSPVLVQDVYVYGVVRAPAIVATYYVQVFAVNTLPGNILYIYNTLPVYPVYTGTHVHTVPV